MNNIFISYLQENNCFQLKIDCQTTKCNFQEQFAWADIISERAYVKKHGISLSLYSSLKF